MPPLRELHLHERADRYLTSAPGFWLTVDTHVAAGDQRLGLAAVRDDVGELEQLPQANAVLADFDLHPASVTHRIRLRVRWSTEVGGRHHTEGGWPGACLLGVRGCENRVMDAAHSHGGPSAAGPGVKRFLGIVVALLVVSTLAGLLVLWPHDAPPPQPWLDADATLATGTVRSITPDDGTGGHLVVDLDSGETVNVPADPSAPLREARVGQRVQVLVLQGQPDAYFFDYQRGAPLLVLALVFVAMVVGVARWKGVAALAGLAAALTLIWMFTLPALGIGEDPLLVALVSAAAVMFVVVYLAHGVSVKTTTALLGTFVGIAAVAALAWWAIPATSLTPLQDETMGQLPSQFPGIDVRGILLCGMVLAGVGVLNDVTITQASAVWELRAAAPGASRRTLFSQAMRIGRDHIASTVYTIAFAYVGTAMAMLLLASRLDFAILDLLTFNTVAEEIVATLVASIGLVGTIPITTALAAWLAAPRLPATPERPRRAWQQAPEPSQPR